MTIYKMQMTIYKMRGRLDNEKPRTAPVKCSCPICTFKKAEEPKFEVFKDKFEFLGKK